LNPDHSGHSNKPLSRPDPDTASAISAAEPTSVQGGVTYSCSMHPEIRRPKCGMTLDPVAPPLREVVESNLTVPGAGT
jgi:hypothetical protein